MMNPKFAYDPGTGIVDFFPTYPPTKKTPFSPLQAVRTDSITSSGIRQSVTERVDEFIVLSFDQVPESDMDNWRAFFDYALIGSEFTYYPDSTDESTSYECLLEDTDWTPKFNSSGYYSFSLKLRKGVGTGFHFS